MVPKRGPGSSTTASGGDPRYPMVVGWWVADLFSWGETKQNRSFFVLFSVKGKSMFIFQILNV